MNSSIKYYVLLLCLNLIEGSFRCDYKYNFEAKGWFKHHVIPANWFDARLRCTLEGGLLASPTTPEIQFEMTNTGKKKEYEIFTGIHATFSQGDYYTVDGIPLSKIPQDWAENEPDNKGNKESCITINGNGELADLSCDETRPYICYHAGDPQVNECGSTDPEYTLDRRTNSCYKFHTVARNYSRAFFACSAEGGYLAIINSDVEAVVLRELFAKYPGGKMVGNFWKDVAFLGYHDWRERWGFRSIHGQTLTEAGYSKYSGGEPNNGAPGESCIALYRSALLDDLWCDRPAPFICEKNPAYPEICQATCGNESNLLAG